MSTRTAAVSVAIGFVGIACFQVALALGAPLGRAAWGGKQRVLPVRLRIGSAVAAVIWIVGTLIVLGRTGFDVVSLPRSVERWGSWLFFGLLVVGTLMNAVSSSRWERFVWAPVSLVLSVLCFVVARS